jgi:uncharacterized protein (DUF302 family)
MTPDGLTICPSHHGPKETMDQAGMELRPTEVVLFGNPRGGTPLMQAVQTMGIDLPLKALVWQDEGGKTWLAYNDPKWLAKRHEALVGMDHALGAMAEALAAVAKEATGA